MNRTNLLLAGCGLSLLTACSPGIFQYDNNPVVMTSLRAGATKQSVLAAAGQPLSSMPLPQINGSCLNYLLRNKDNTMPFYVAFNADGRVVNAGYTTCEDAASSGFLNSSEPMKQKY